MGPLSSAVLPIAASLQLLQRALIQRSARVIAVSTLCESLHLLRPCKSSCLFVSKTNIAGECMHQGSSAFLSFELVLSGHSC